MIATKLRIVGNSKKSIIGIIICLLFMMVLPFFAQALGGMTWVRIIDQALLYVMLALGLNIVVGFAGLLDLGYIAFYAVGAYAAALLTTSHLTDSFAHIAAMFPAGIHLPFLLVMVVGAVLAAIAGIMLGAPILKLKGDYLALVTLGFGEIIRIFMNNLGKDVFNITNGPRGINGIEPVSIFGFSFDQTIHIGSLTLTREFLYFYLFLALAMFSMFICYRLQNSRLGRAWMAFREDDVAARAMGINLRNIKLLAFSLGATFGGVAGSLFAAFQGFISPESFSFMESIAILTMVVLGGIGHIPGVILGAFVITALPEILRYTIEPLQKAIFGQIFIDSAVLRPLILGLCMVMVMLFRPKGLWPKPERNDKRDDEISDDAKVIPTEVL
ncbi:high-affinity branched-chain amino acid ABC transporter permease LivM [Psychrobacter sp.]|uniref:branched-chain amino acid ABC transporter permease n=1 Tax=Psychrobacter sp. TaxID=56811 RepID=UPI0025EA7BE5|nr:high-affinity branched-chain amino acid ABC transporter permease LivM [Psychrobacter sp.]